MTTAYNRIGEFIRVLILLSAALLGACSWSEPVSDAGDRETPVERPREYGSQSPAVDSGWSSLQAVITTAKRQVGRPYRYGGSSPAGFDCSGLVHYAYGIAGVSTPRTTKALWRDLPKLGKSSLRPGDVLFFNIDGKPSHVGLYLGDGEFVHAPSTGRQVSVAQLSSPFYSRTFIGAGRVISQ